MRRPESETQHRDRLAGYWPRPPVFLQLVWIVIAMFAGVCGGAAQILCDRLVTPDAFRDGQYVFTFLVTLPLGGIAGGVVGAAAQTGREGGDGALVVGGVFLAFVTYVLVKSWSFSHASWVILFYLVAAGLTLVGLVRLGASSRMGTSLADSSEEGGDAG